MTDDEFDRKIDEVLADPRAREEIERHRRESPHMTLRQLAAHWIYADELLGE